ncbi:MAG: 4'-phosphopantetheinyl transferase superfamily protein [Desulfobacterales bacterium]|nr:4'-phosphopantetheinyl transferase superfamily protein [Desulfobacterales bacterium]
MEGLSKIKEKVRLPLSISIHPHLMDHRVEGHAVIPAVEAMQILAASVKSFKPDADLTCLTNAGFNKFLYIHAGDKHLSAFNDIVVYENGDITAGLLTKTKSPKSSITRIKEHAKICFPHKAEKTKELPYDVISALEGVTSEVPAHKIYNDLVPFGPAYQNIQGVLYISKDGAIANIHAPVMPGNQGTSELLGSPFPLDAAFHTACVWGQKFAQFVAFPAAFEKRVILNRTQPGKAYISRVIPIRTKPDLLIFDVWIYDSKGVLFEAISGIRMRDVSGGRMKPPQWLKSEKTSKSKGIFNGRNSFSIIELKTIMPFAEKSLSNDELKRFEKMGEKRKQSYLGARLACKRLSRKLSNNDMQTPAQDISTICSDQVRPSCPLTDGSEPCSCSVSHDSRFAVSVASEKKVGIDVEKISGRVLKSRDFYIREEEKALVRDSTLGEIEASLRVWSIKEAVSKASNIGLTDSWKKVMVKDIGKHESSIDIENKEGYTVFHDTIDQHLFTLIEMG